MVDTKTLLEWSGKYHTPNYGARAPICLVRGDGMRVWDTDGREYLDFGAGIAVTALGHCHPRVTGAIQEASATLLHVSNLYHTAPQIHLAKLLCTVRGSGLLQLGAEANEAAIARPRRARAVRVRPLGFVATRNLPRPDDGGAAATGQEKYRSDSGRWSWASHAPQRPPGDGARGRQPDVRGARGVHPGRRWRARGRRRLPARVA